jgi:hypothetical protein
VRRIALCGFGLLDWCGESMNSLRFGTVLTVAIALSLFGQAVAQDEAGKAAVKDDSGKVEVQGEASKAGAPDTAKKAGAPDEAGKAAVKDDSGRAEVQGEASKAGAPDTAKKAGAPDEAGKAAAKDDSGKAEVQGEASKAGAPDTAKKAGAPDEAGKAAAKDDSGKAEVQGEASKAGAPDTAKKASAPDEGRQEAAAICKNPQCSVIVGAWQQDIKACVTKNARLKELEGEVGTLQVKGKELAACSDARAEADKRAKEATDRVDSLQKELEVLKQAAAAAAGDPQKYLEAVERAMQWKEVAERVKEEADAAKKEADAAKKEVTDLKSKVASLEAQAGNDPNRGMKNVDKETKTSAGDTKVDETALSDLEQKNKKLRDILDDTRRVLVEKQKEMEVSDGAIRQVLTDLVDRLGKTFECASFSVEMKNGARVLKGTVGEGKHRDEAWKMVLDSPLARLVHSSEIDVTAAGGGVCFVKTREPGWLMARSRDKADQGATLFLRFALDPSVIQMLPRASDHAECAKLGAVVKALEPLEPRPSELAVWVRGSNGAVTQCYAAPDGWKLRYRVPDRDGKWPAWILLREGDTGGGGGVRP